MLTELKLMNYKFFLQSSIETIITCVIHASVQVFRKAIARTGHHFSKKKGTDHQLQEQRRSLGKLVSYKNLRAAFSQEAHIQQLVVVAEALCPS